MKKESLLWKLEVEGNPAPSYLFGSMHVRDRRAFQRLSGVQEMIAACDGFAAEFHLDEMGKGLHPDLIQLPDGQSLHQLFPKKKYKRYRTALLRSTGFDLADVDRNLPFLVVSLVSEHLLQSDMPETLDVYLWNCAKAAGKSLHGIETLQEQLEVLKKITLEEQLKMLAGLCGNPGKFRRYLSKLTELYEQGKVQRLYNLVKKNTKHLRQLMLYHRNEVMAERICTLMQDRSMFIVIGAAHLGGGKGVLRLLKRNGLRLSPMLT